MGSTALKEVYYKRNLILMTFLRAVKKYGYSFSISTNWDDAKKFNDLFLIYSNSARETSLRSLQVVYESDESKTLNYNSLFYSTKFNIDIYFNSFRKQFKYQNNNYFFLFTNLNIDGNLLPYVFEVNIDESDSILNFSETKRNGTQYKQFYKLNDAFIEAFKRNRKLMLANELLDYCLGNMKLRITNDNLFKVYHLILLKEVINSKKNCFRRDFVKRQNLSMGTLMFRDIFDQQLEKRHLPNTSIEERDIWLSNLRICVSSHFGKIPENQGLHHIHFDDEDWLFHIFCSHLIIALKQPNWKKLESIIKSECQNLIRPWSSNHYAALLMGELQFRLLTWFKVTNTNSKHLNFETFNDIFEYIKENESEAIAANSSRNEISDLRSFNNVEFKDTHYGHALKQFLIDKDKKCLQINTSGSSGVSLLKLFQCLEKRLYLFTAKTSINEITKLQQLIISSEQYHILVWEISIGADDDNALKSSLMKTIPNIKKKKLIIVNNNKDSVPFKLVGNQISFIEDRTTFGELTDETQKRLLRKSVFFQNDLVEFERMFDIPLSHIETDSWCSLLQHNTSIGRKVNISDDYNAAYYINRSIKREGPSEELDESSFMNLRVLAPAIQSSDVDSHQKVFIIADQAGMGKSIFSSHLAREIKMVSPHFWVVRLVAMECVQNLTWLTTSLQANRKVKEDVLLSDFVMNKLLELVAPIERYIFGQFLEDEIVPNKLVFLFDGYDEIDAKCQKMIIRVLKYLSTKPNVISIGITTRPQFKERLELEFQQNSYILEAFTEQNKLDFLKKFWSFKGKIKVSSALQLFAKRLIAGVSKSLTEKDTQLTGIPLQMRMIGEIYKSEAIEFKGLEDKSAKEPVAVGLYNLYEMFVKSKENIFLTQKIGAVAIQLDPHVLSSVKKHQSRYARQIILGDSEDGCISNADDLAQTISLGIIQRNQGGFYFIHRTFAEFLTAKFLLGEYILNEAASVTDIITKGFLIDRIRDTSLNVVRKFINCELHHANLVRKIKESGGEAEIRELMSKTCPEIAYYLVEEENFEILRFILEIFLWLEPQKMENFITPFVFIAYDLTKNDLAPTVILDWMMAKWRADESLILLSTLKYLLTLILRSHFQGGKRNYKFVACVIYFQDELEKLQVLDEVNLTHILSLINLETTDDTLRYWSRFSIDYLVNLHLKHRDIFYDFLKQRPELTATMLAAMLGGIPLRFLNIFKNDESIDGDSIYDILVEGDMQRFNLWNKKIFHEYFATLSVHASKFSAERNKKFQIKLAEFISLLSSNFDMTIEKTCSTFIGNYNKFVPLKKIMQQFLKTITLSDLEHYALWSQTSKLRSILTVGSIEKEAEIDLKFTARDSWLDKRRKILNNFRKRHTNEEFIEKVSAKNQQNDTMLIHAIERQDKYNIDFFSSWINSEEMLLKMMNVMGKMFTFHTPFDFFVCFVENMFPQYLVRFLEGHKNEFIYWGHSSEEIFRILADESVGEEDFVNLLSMHKDIEWLGNETLVHHIIGWWCKPEIMEQWLYLMKRKCKNTDNIVKLFSLKRKEDESPIDIIRWDSNLLDRKERYKLLLEFFTDLGLVVLKEEVELLMRFRKGVYEDEDEGEETEEEEEEEEEEEKKQIEEPGANDETDEPGEPKDAEGIKIPDDSIEIIK